MNFESCLLIFHRKLFFQNFRFKNLLMCRYFLTIPEGSLFVTLVKTPSFNIKTQHDYACIQEDTSKGFFHYQGLFFLINKASVMYIDMTV